MENHRKVAECFVGFYVGLVRNVDFFLLLFMVKFVLQYLNKWTLIYLEIPVICNSDPVTLRLILRKHQPTSQGISTFQSCFWIVALSQCDDLEHQPLDLAVLWGLWGRAYAS